MSSVWLTKNIYKNAKAKEHFAELYLGISNSYLHKERVCLCINSYRKWSAYSQAQVQLQLSHLQDAAWEHIPWAHLLLVTQKSTGNLVSSFTPCVKWLQVEEVTLHCGSGMRASDQRGPKGSRDMCERLKFKSTSVKSSVFRNFL